MVTSLFSLNEYSQQDTWKWFMMKWKQFKAETRAIMKAALKWKKVILPVRALELRRWNATQLSSSLSMNTTPDVMKRSNSAFRDLYDDQLERLLSRFPADRALPRVCVCVCVCVCERERERERENDRCVCVTLSYYAWTRLICSAATRRDATQQNAMTVQNAERHGVLFFQEMLCDRKKVTFQQVLFSHHKRGSNHKCHISFSCFKPKELLL